MQKKMASIEEFGRFMPLGIVFRRKPFEDDNLDPDESVDREVDEGIDESAEDRRKADEEEEAERDTRGKNRPRGKSNGQKKASDDDCVDCEGPHDPDAIDHPAPSSRGSTGSSPTMTMTVRPGGTSPTARATWTSSAGRYRTATKATMAPTPS